MKLTMSTNYAAMFYGAVAAGVRYFSNHPSLKSMVLGVSGGIDSAVTAMLAREVADIMGIQLYGYSLPIVSNKPGEMSRASGIGLTYCHDFAEVNLSDYWLDLMLAVDPKLGERFKTNQKIGAVETDHDIKVRMGNIKARMRMIYLYNQAHKHNGLVLSTDNFTELMLGFWTLHGDVGDFGFIQNLWKTEVYGLADWRVCKILEGGVHGSSEEEALIACIDAVPTDGLGVTGSDFDQLMPWAGLSGDGHEKRDNRKGYYVIDTTLLDFLNSGIRPSDKDDDRWDVLRRYKNSKFKRDNPVNVPREELV